MAETALGPDERSGAQDTPTSASTVAERAKVTLAAIERATLCLLDAVDQLDDLSVRHPSLLPGWTRAHLISHLARNADACRNLLVWARTGVEHPMYASRADRDADIEEGSRRGQWLLAEDLAAAAGRFTHTARTLPEPAWSQEVVVGQDHPMLAQGVLRIRLLEVWVHLADLDHRFGFDDIPHPDIEHVLEDVAQQFGGRADVPAISLTAQFPGGRHRRWSLHRTSSKPREITGAAGPMLGWLLGRTGSQRLVGDVPELPTWL